jgi:hypothetical protein
LFLWVMGHEGRLSLSGRLLAAALVCALVGGAVATAQAQEDPNATIEEQAKTYGLDTDYTPVAKPTDLWTLIHGAEYPETQAIDGSATTFDTNLYTVSFQNRTIGLAAGSACAIEPIQQKGEEDDDFARRATECEGTDGAKVPRVPALYRYSEPKNEDPRWERLELPNEGSPDDNGYIGAITWIDPQRALIVGGTGTYPSRELGASQQDHLGRQNSIPRPTDPEKADIAGDARAWVYDRATGELEEKDLSQLTSETSVDGTTRAGMRGLTAADCYEDPQPQFQEAKLELCFAGALGQIWEWRDGEFNGTRIDAMSPEQELEAAMLFRYRVREIVFRPEEPPVAVAATSGCCAQVGQENTPRVLVYDHASRICQPALPLTSGQCTRTGPSRWYARSFYDRVGDPGDVPKSTPNVLGIVADVPVVGGEPIVPTDVDNSRREVNDVPHWPDSIYSLSPGGSALLSPGGPEAPGERGSVVTKNYSHHHQPQRPGLTAVVEPELEGVVRAFATARLHDTDGGWLMGELRSSRRGFLGAQGLVIGGPRPTAQDAINDDVTPENASSYEPVDQNKLDASIRSRYYLLPSYSANAIEIVGAAEDGWIVGDRGAILRISEKALQQVEGATEPKPPRLGATRTDALSDSSAYAESRPELPKGTGVVPALGTETDQLDEPKMTLQGSPGGEVGDMVMSRDGTEGWAVANGNRFLRFDGVAWSECDPLGLEGLTEPDPACEAMAPLRGWRDADKNLRTLRIDHMTRVPLENDLDPTNDDELEVVGVGISRYSGPEYRGESLPTVVRYLDGRWHFEQPDAVRALNKTRATVGTASGDVTGIIDVAFTARDEGWLIASYSSHGGGGARLYRFEGERWVDCEAEAVSCGGPSTTRITQWADEMSGLTVAGDRVYLYGRRRGRACATNVCPTLSDSPMIVYHDHGGGWTDGSGKGEDGGGFDPAFTNPGTEQAGHVDSLSVVERPDGGFEGWAVGEFGTGADAETVGLARVPRSAVLMRLDPKLGKGWHPHQSPGPLEDYMLSHPLGQKSPPTNALLNVSYPSDLSPDGVFIGQQFGGSQFDGNRLFGFDSARDRFELIESEQPQDGGGAYPAGTINAMAPDAAGGFWAAIEGQFFHYTDQPPKQPFEEIANPLGIRNTRIRDLTGGPDGSVWIATDSDRLYRHDRLTGWEEARVPGWDPGRVVTRASEAEALAVGPGGQGLVVGDGGRIAQLSPQGVVLDRAAGRSCALQDPRPCGTARDLSAVDIAPDGSALAAGERMTILWRPANGEFREAQKPPIAASTRITAVSFPTPTSAYLATNAGVVFRGRLSGESWDWESEATMPDGELLAVDPQRKPIPLNDVAVDGSGHGYAVGESGLVLERSADGRWRRLSSSYREDLTAVALPDAGGEGVLVGGEDGLILTGADSELRIARPADFAKVTSDAVAGFAYLPSSRDGSVDAWAAVTAPPSGKGADRLLRYRSEVGAAEDANARLEPLPDAPARSDGELSLAAFGKSDCDTPDNGLCPELSATTTTNRVITRRIVDELAGLHDGGELDVAVGSGDATDSAGLPASSLADLDALGSPTQEFLTKTQRAGQLKHRRYVELVADELVDRGVPLLAAIGGQDLSETFACESFGGCATTKPIATAGENFAWREAFAGRSAPWGDGSDILDGESALEGASDRESPLQLEPAPGSEDNSLRIEDQRTDADGEGAAPEAKAEIGGASTHYAVDATRGGEAVARIVFVDTSLKSLAASDAIQQPHELAGGQLRFLERMICTEGSSSTFGDGCTRTKDQKAIVVSNTPTYSYGPGALTHTATDGNVFEALMLKHRVDLVISGALGYNGLYYTLAPGIHEPCPAGEYPHAPPSGQTPDCLAGPAGPAEAATDKAPTEAPDPASVIVGQGLSGAYPTLIASGAGGKFGPDGTEPPDGPAGQWHGYSVARLLPNGELVVEQRPILDWIGLDAADHALPPRSRLTLNGYGRSPISTQAYDQRLRAFHYEISNPAITHRYDLVLADPERPWLPCEAADPGCVELQANLSRPSGEGSVEDAASSDAGHCAPYLCLPSRIGTVEDQSGQIRAGDGRYPETFAIAMLSVDEEVATYPLVFERSPAFVTSPSIRSGALPKLSGARPGAPPPPPPPPGLPQIPQVEIPQIPPPPGIPQLSAATPPELQPPAPPAPPPPSQQPAPLDLSVAPPGVSISTPTALIQPPTPPVNPAPPGGARREARQRQAAAQKGGADSSEQSEETQGGGGDLAQGRPDNANAATRQTHDFTARRRTRPEPSFTALSRTDEPSASAQGVLYGGGIALAAAVLALGFTTLRPTPRRRQPEVPAPARSTARPHRR